MATVESTVFHHLREFRKQANRERFVLPKNKEISFFSDTKKKFIDFLKN
jgi:hypothetical protein